MTENRRIFWNVVATYGRSLYVLVIGLLTSRWSLQALGHIDYGLYGVVGGLSMFISFINRLLATAVGRFYAVSVGKARVPGQEKEGLEECRQWFSSAVLIHTIIPVILIAIGYPVGCWAIRSVLTIPADRVMDCIWVFRFVCLSCFVGMVTVPYNAMYTAKQYIAELTIYTFVTASLNVVVLYYMVEHPGLWLKKYAAWICITELLPLIIIALRGHYLFEECRLVYRYCFSLSRIRQMTYFVGCWAFGMTGGLLRQQGVQLVVNKYFGPVVNAAMAIAGTVNAHTTSLAGSMVGALQPAIVSAYGEGNLDRMRKLAFCACKMSALAILLFVIPLTIELEYVLKLWLVNPPEYVPGLCLFMFAMTLVDQLAVGHVMAVNAVGKIAAYQIVLGSILILALPMAWLLCFLGFNIYGVCFSLFLTMLLSVVGRVWFARKLVGMSSLYWLYKVVLPTVGLASATFLIATIPVFLMHESVIRVLSCAVLSSITMCSLVWFCVFDKEEKIYLSSRVMALKRRFFK